MSGSGMQRSNCGVCGQEFPKHELTMTSDMQPLLRETIRSDFPRIDQTAGLCPDCLRRYRQRYLMQLLTDEAGELGALESEVAETLGTDQLLSLRNARDDQQEDEHTGFGARMADRVAEWGGSWTFILIFVALLLGWMGVNALLLLNKGFDPYPFILLNLVLSCVAALQAPIIMMSQRRQEAQDRRRAENDYRINLKAELELRMLHDKLDHQITHQWKRLMEIQRLQIDLLQDLQGAAQGTRTKRPVGDEG